MVLRNLPFLPVILIPVLVGCAILEQIPPFLSGDRFQVSIGLALVFTLVAAAALWFAFLNCRYAWRVAYAVTDRRALIYYKSIFGVETLRAFPGSDLTRAAMVLRSSGDGDVALRQVENVGSGRRNTRVLVGFFCISDPREALDQIRAIARGSTPTNTGAAPTEWRWRILVIPIVFGLIALPLAIFTGRDFYRSVASISWVPAQAVVLDSHVASRHGKGTSYFPYVSYQFTASGQNYFGSTVEFGGVAGWKYAKNTVDRLRLRSTITIHYDPSDPNQSVIYEGLRPAAAIPFGLTLDIFATTVSIGFIIRRNAIPRDAIRVIGGT
jgi:hypothetical protein